MKNSEVIVVGDGAIGLCTAYYLSKYDVDVTILTASEEGEQQNCSYGNAGMVVPSHFTPLAAPGVVKQGIKWMLNSNSPLYIKPRANRQLASWLWKFYQSSSQANVDSSSQLLYDMNTLSRELFKEISNSEKVNFELEQKGLMMLYKSHKCQEAEEVLATKALNFGIESEILDSAQLQKLEPEYRPDVIGGVLYKSDAHMDPRLFMESLRSIVIQRGVKIQYGCKVDGFKLKSSSVSELTTNLGNMSATNVVICAGAWTGSLVKRLDLKIPLMGGKGYSITVNSPDKMINYPTVLCESKVAVTPMGTDLRIAGTMEIVGQDLSQNQKRVDNIKKAMAEYFLGFDSSQMEDQKSWAGLRPVSPDGMPFIGKAEGYDNLYLNTGHAMMGLSLAPISGKLVAQLITGKTTEFKIERLNPNRF